MSLRAITLNERLIWIVDSEHWPRSALRAELIERGYEAIGHIRLDEALSRLHSAPSQAKPHAIVVDLCGQEVSRGALQELAGSTIPTIILGGQAELNDPLIKEHTWTAMLKRPIMLGEIADLIERIVPLRRDMH